MKKNNLKNLKELIETLEKAGEHKNDPLNLHEMFISIKTYLESNRTNENSLDIYSMEFLRQT